MDALAVILDRIAGTPGAVSEVVAVAQRSARVLERSADEYREKHWGIAPTKGVVKTTVVDPSGQPLIVLGELAEIGYITRKGNERASSIYVHKFADPEDGAPRVGAQFPLLCYVPGAKKGGLVIAGGTYRVEDRGIVG